MERERYKKEAWKEKYRTLCYLNEVHSEIVCLSINMTKNASSAGEESERQHKRKIFWRVFTLWGPESIFVFSYSSMKAWEMWYHLCCEASTRKNEWERDNQSLPTGCISKAARLKGTRGCMCSGAAISLGDESSSKPDTGSCRRRIAVLSPLKTKHTHTQLHTQTHTCWWPWQWWLAPIRSRAGCGWLGAWRRWRSTEESDTWRRRKPVTTHTGRNLGKRKRCHFSCFIFPLCVAVWSLSQHALGKR